MSNGENEKDGGMISTGNAKTGDGDTGNDKEPVLAAADALKHMSDAVRLAAIKASAVVAAGVLSTFVADAVHAQAPGAFDHAWTEIAKKVDSVSGKMSDQKLIAAIKAAAVIAAAILARFVPEAVHAQIPGAVHHGWEQAVKNL